MADAVRAGFGCLYCQSPRAEPLFDGVHDRLHHVAGSFTFVRCLDCGSARLAPLPRPEELAAYYPPVYSFTTDLGRQHPLRRLLARAEYRLFFGPQYEAEARRVLAAIGWLRGTRGRLLDIGCGRGLRLRAFQRRGFEVVGADLQDEVVDYVRRELGIAAVSSDVEGLLRHFSRSSFDIVTAFFVLEHVTSVDVVLDRAFRLLVPGGWFVGAIPFIDSVQGRLFGRRWINVTEAPRHLSLPTRAGAITACGRAGFVNVAVRPDSTMNCAGQVGLTVFPNGAITHAYARGGRALLARLAGALVTLAAIPFCAVENSLVGRPSLGIVFAQKPAPAVR
jgi:SAM-dependent methyltransferase